MPATGDAGEGYVISEGGAGALPMLENGEIRGDGNLPETEHLVTFRTEKIVFYRFWQVLKT